MSSNGSSCPSNPEENYARIFSKYKYVLLLPSYWIPVTIVYVAILIASWLGNCLVLTAIIRTKSLHTTTNLLCASLAFSDMMSVLVGSIIVYTDIHMEWIFGPILCAIYNYTDPFAFSSILTLTTISVERFRLTVFPHLPPWSWREGIFIIMVIYAVSALSFLPGLWKTRVAFIKSVCMMLCNVDLRENSETAMLYAGYVLFAVYFGPLTLSTFSYLSISISIKKSTAATAQTADRVRRLAAAKQHKHMNRIFVLMIVGFALSWSFFILLTVGAYFNFLPSFVEKQMPFFHCIGFILSTTATVWNPWLYIALSHQMRSAIHCYLPSGVRSVVKNISSVSVKPQSISSNSIRTSH